MVKEKEQASLVQQRRAEDVLAWSEEIKRLYERTMRGIGIGPWRPLTPFLFVLEKNGTILLHADLSGMQQQDMELVVEGDMLLIKGQQNEETQTAEEFYGAIALPAGVDVKAIGASYKDGVLEVRMPQSVAKKVKVRLV